jgi:hypothetical protein
MVLVPLLVGVAVLVVAASARRDLERERSLLGLCCEEARDLSVKHIGPFPPNVLEASFPHLDLWCPGQDRIYCSTQQPDGGTAGPDIVIRRAAVLDEQQQLQQTALSRAA